jgi:hypothetical protein
VNSFRSGAYTGKVVVFDYSADNGSAHYRMADLELPRKFVALLGAF